jgi:hypothetical protein
MNTETTMNTAPETAYIGATIDGIVVAFHRGGFPTGRAKITRPTTPQAQQLWDDALTAYHAATQRAYAAERAALGGKRAAAKIRAAAVAAADERACSVLIYASFVRV